MLRALVLVPVTSAALHTIGFRRWSSFLSKFAPKKNPTAEVTPESLESARRTARMVATASNEGIIHGQCLEESIVLWWLLKRQRLPAELQIGGRRKGAEFEAHAWVELDGNPVNDHEDVGQDFARFSREPYFFGD